MVQNRWKHALRTAGIVLPLIIAIGCSPSGDSQAPNTGATPEPSILEQSWPAMAVVDWSQVDFSDPQTVADFAQADFLVLETAFLWRDGLNEGALDAIRALNPDIKIVGYVSAHAAWLSWGEVDRSDAASPHYGWDWYESTRDFWSYTTTGDTMFSFPGKILLDVLDPNCRETMVQVLSDHWYAHSNVLDGIFWDHFNPYLWVPLQIEGVDGEMDLDRDGIAHRDDQDEMAAYRAASEDLVIRTRRALGGDVIQIANGGRATTDSTFAALLDGMFYENFPQYAWTRSGMRGALDPDRSNNLFAARAWPRTVNGGPWLILSNTGGFTSLDENQELVTWRNADFNRAAALLAGCVPVYYPVGSQYRYGWPDVEVELGLPTSAAVIDGERISREFERGRVVLDFGGATSVAPFEFVVVQRDSIRQRYEMDDFLP